MRALAIFIFLASALSGAKAYGYSVLEICKGPDQSVSDFRNRYESYKKQEELGKQRQKSLMNWLTTAPSEDVSDVWGQPQHYQDHKVWIVQLEPYPRVYSDLIEKEDTLCFHFDRVNSRSYIFVELEPGQTSRRVHNVIWSHP